MKQKKFFFALFLVLLSCGISYAQNITFGAWGRVLITPFAAMGKSSSVSAATSTWYDVPYISFSANGTAPSGNIGFNIDFDFGYNFETNSTNVVGDNAKAWVKPLGMVLPGEFNMLKLTAGKFNEDDFRGRVGATEFSSWLLPSGGKDEDSIFYRFQGGAAAHVKLEPLMWLDSEWNGLIIEGAFGSSGQGQDINVLRAIRNLLNNEDNRTVEDERALYDPDNPTNLFYDGDRHMSAADVYRAGQYGIGYTIPDIGMVRAQFIGGNLGAFRLVSTGKDYAGLRDQYKQLMRGLNKQAAYLEADVIEGAFLFKSGLVEGLTVDIGVKIPLEYKTKANFAVYPAVYGKTQDPLYTNSTNATGDKPSKGNNEFTIQSPYNIAAGLIWTPSFLEELSIMARVDYTFGGHIRGTITGTSNMDVDLLTGANVNAWLVPSYKIIPNLTVGIDLGMEIRLEDTLTLNGNPDSIKRTEYSKHTDFGVGPWMELGVGGGKVRVGVSIMIPDSYRYVFNANKSTDLYKYSYMFTPQPIVSVPISITYSF